LVTNALVCSRERWADLKVCRERAYGMRRRGWSCRCGQYVG
jgi:hypothetical protein